MARSIVALAVAVILAGSLVAPSNAQALYGVITQINYCVGNASVPTACPSMTPLFVALNVTARLQEAFLSEDTPSGSPLGAPAPAPTSPYAACYNTLTKDSFIDGINPALVLPMCNNTRCAAAAARVDTCITAVIDNIADPEASPAAAPSPSDAGEGSNNPDVSGSLTEFCASPVCISTAKALSPPSPPPPPGSAATLKMSVLGVATLSMIVVGAAL
ncbi:hypothetical protein KFL_005010080 [Klebsormidium nitens]|uniref:SPARK domain-containing protein n=1 Tax=Klebsormidium nitens TaxID=105231 RepID=A0A1Y1IIB1_KLENI|nr:hypothetical protein KFL_005010080 [Klebsormidium nitens]|eukprot:GAQ89239.1 hypothetical protein KFL_005010080 [Klebsormidium nitens]